MKEMPVFSHLLQLNSQNQRYAINLDLSTGDWIKQMWDMCLIDYHSAIEKNETLTFAAKGMKLENIMLSEKSQIEKDKFYASSHPWKLIENIKNIYIVDLEYKQESCLQ